MCFEIGRNEMKRFVFIALIMFLLISMNANEIKLKYLSVDDSTGEIQEYIDLFKNTIEVMQSWQLSYKKSSERLNVYMDSLSINIRSRFAYLDWKISNLYPEFFAEFDNVNSRMSYLCNNGLYNREDIYFYSIYPKHQWDILFSEDKTIKTQIIPDVLGIRLTLWKSLIKDNPEFEFFLETSPFNIWAVVKFTNIEKVPTKHHFAKNACYTECLFIDSPFEELIGKRINMRVNMFDSEKEYELDKAYLVNLSYLISPSLASSIATSPLGTTEIIINPLMNYSSQINRVYDLNGDSITLTPLLTLYSIDYHPLGKSGITSKSLLFSKIEELVESLRTRGEK